MRNCLRLFIRAATQWNDNSDSRQGAALAYYALFSLAPLLVIAVDIAAIVFGEQAARGNIETHLTEVVGADTARSVQKLVDNVATPKGTLATVISFGLLVFGAMGVFVETRGALQSIWKLEPPVRSGILRFVLNYVFALSMVLAVGILLIGSLVASMVMSLMERWLTARVPQVPWQLTEVVVSFLLVTILFTAIYWILSGRLISWRHAFYGALVASVLFTLGKTGIAWYLTATSTVTAYGVASSIVALLIWVYYSAQILFFGAEFVQALRLDHGDAVGC